MATELNIGDLFEISTPPGLAYLQLTHTDPDQGSLIRVLPGTHGGRPEALEPIVQTHEQFHAFFPLAAALRRGIVERVGNYEVPATSRSFPTFRSSTKNPVTDEWEDWWLWDGQREWKVAELSDAQRDLSPGGIINDTLLIDRVVSGWRPRDFG